MRRTLLLIALFVWPFVAMSQTNNPTEKNAEIMRQLRLKILTAPASEIGLQPTKDHPRVYTVLMDWVLEKTIVSAYGSCTGDASIYTTSTFGVFGGIGHETVRAAAGQFVKAGEKHFDDAISVKNYPYPKPGRVYFYLVCFDGVRMIDADEQSLRSGKDKFSDLYSCGQRVIAELRLVAEKKQ